MLQIIKKEFFTCKICKSSYNEQNYPVSLNCSETLCFNCKNKMLNNNGLCPFDESHTHTEKTAVKNICMIDIMEDIMKLIKVNEKKNKYNLDLIKLFEELKKMNKKGEYQNEEIMFKGIIKGNRPIGKGELIHKNIGIFKGKFFGEFHKGKGEINYNDSSYYIGEWENYKRQKKGVLTFSNLNKYEGEFKDDLFNGCGQLYIDDKQIYYIGKWINGKKEGQFILLDENRKFLRIENYKNNILQ